MTRRKIDSTLSPGFYYFSGNEAVAEGAIAAGCRYYAGYPITPSSETMERISIRFKDVDGVFMQMGDEIASICSVIGAVWAGAKTMWPFADRIIREIGGSVKKLFVPEMNRGQIIGEVMKYAGSEVIAYNQSDGEIIHPHRIMEEVRKLV